MFSQLGTFARKQLNRTDLTERQKYLLKSSTTYWQQLTDEKKDEYNKLWKDGIDIDIFFNKLQYGQEDFLYDKSESLAQYHDELEKRNDLKQKFLNLSGGKRRKSRKSRKSRKHKKYRKSRKHKKYRKFSKKR